MRQRYRVLSYGGFHSSHDNLDDARKVAKGLCTPYYNWVKIYDDSSEAFKQFGLIETWSNQYAWSTVEGAV